MQLYEQKFDDALKYLSSSDILNPIGGRPICYVTYDVEDAMDVYRRIHSSLIPKATYYGFVNVKCLSIGDILQQYIKDHEYYAEAWEDEGNEADLYKSISQEIQSNSCVSKSILENQEELKKTQRPLLIIKDLELLHPYDKMGRIEQEIYNKIEIPIMVFYPGSAQGVAKTFLNIYPMDGSYRSKNF